MLLEVQVSIREEGRIRGVIVGLVKVDKLLILEVGDVFWLTARVVLVLCFLEEVLIDLLHKRAAWTTHCSLHFIVDDAPNFQAALLVFCVVELQLMALLPEVEVA